jgi:hypothetical protein
MDENPLEVSMVVLVEELTQVLKKFSLDSGYPFDELISIFLLQKLQYKEKKKRGFKHKTIYLPSFLFDSNVGGETIGYNSS